MTSTKVMGNASNFVDAVLPVSNKAKSELGDFKSFLNLSNNQNNLEAVSQPVKALAAKDEAKEDFRTDNTVKSEKLVKEQTKTESREVEDADVEEVKDAVDKVVEEVKDELDVTDEEVKAALETLGLTPIALLNPENIKNLVVELSNIEDPILLATNEELLDTVSAIEEEVETIVEDICKALDIDSEEFLNAIEKYTKPQEMPVEETDVAADNQNLAEELFKKIEVEADLPLKEDNNSKAVETTALDETAAVVENDGKEVKEDSQVRRVANQQGEAPVESFTTIQNQTKTVAKTGEGSKEEFSHQGNEKSNDNILSFAENLVKETVEALNENPENVSFSTVDAERIINQITESIKTQISAETTEINMKLHPESLGNVNVKIVSNNEGVLTARFIAENEAVKSVIEAQATSLKESLEAKGVTIEAVEVMVGSHRFDENFSRERGNEENNTSGRKNIRRINLSEDEALEEIESEDQAENLAKEIMRQNGNTIDYTA